MQAFLTIISPTVFMHKFVVDVESKPGNAQGLTKCHKETNFTHIIAPGSCTVVENSLRWVKD